MNTEELLFETPADFRQWLASNAETSGGVWLIFGKKGGPKTLSAAAALEEALCFGWIDGQMKSLDEQRYRKYFAPRRTGSPWSLKNRETAEKLIAAGRMQPPGHARIEEAKASGAWDAASAMPPVSELMMEALLQALAGREPALSNFRAMSPSVQHTYARWYHSSKNEETRKRHLEKITERLDQNLKPM